MSTVIDIPESWGELETKRRQAKAVREGIKENAIDYGEVSIEERPGGLNYKRRNYVSFISNDELGRARVAVERGAEFLDERMPGWADLIILESLVLSDCDICVCGQLAYAVEVARDQYGSRFFPMLEHLGLVHPTSWKYGFLYNPPHFHYPALEVEWHRLVSARRA